MNQRLTGWLWWQCLVLAGSVLVASAAQARGEGRVTVELPAKVQVKKGDVLLTDIAKVHGASLPRQLLLGNVFLGRMPVNGPAMTVEREALSRWVRQQTGLKANQFELKGAPFVEVSWLRSTVSGGSILQVATDGLHRWLMERSGRAELRADSEVADLAVPGDDVLLKVRPINDAVPREQMLVWVEVFSGERFFKAVPVKFNVRAWSLALVATQSASAGEQLPNDGVHRVDVNVAKLPLRVAAFVGRPIALDSTTRLTRAVSEGDMLTSAHFEPLPAIARGDWALLQSGAGAVVLESRVQVSQDAKVGQIIRVKPAQSSAYVWARVKGPNLLELAQ
jgi:flagellar basal body P-ring formation protein FlgA